MIAQTVVASVNARPFVGTRLTKAAKNGTKVVARAGNWFPGSEFPSYLESLPAAYGFDPLKLGENASNLKRFQESEVIHGRWAMLGAAGAIGAEVLGQGDWLDVQLKLANGGHAAYFGVENPLDLNTLMVIEFAAMAGVESFRGAADGDKKMYPGGAFDPMGMSKGNLEELKTKELKNGRLAMLAFLGIVAQHFATGATPVEALKAHLADPFSVNFATNGISLPF